MTMIWKVGSLRKMGKCILVFHAEEIYLDM